MQNIPRLEHGKTVVFLPIFVHQGIDPNRKTLREPIQEIAERFIDGTLSVKFLGWGRRPDEAATLLRNLLRDVDDAPASLESPQTPLLPTSPIFVTSGRPLQRAR